MSPTKAGPANQHELLHGHYGHWDCCLCRLELKVEQFGKWLDREIDKATDGWAENDPESMGAFNALQEVRHQLRCHGIPAKASAA